MKLVHLLAKFQSYLSTHLPLFIFTCLLLVVISLPYIYATVSASDSYVFGGFLLNPLDGNSYLAKLYQGWSGSWHFTLPFSAEAGQGGYLFLFYLFLGHLARWTGVSTLVMFHLARLVSAVFLVWAIYRFLSRLLASSNPPVAIFALAVFGSGLGWLAIPFGAFTSDFWVAETYPFLSAYTNPHFTLGLALLIFLLTQALQPSVSIPTDAGQSSIARIKKPLSILLPSCLLALVNPFGVLIALMALGGLVVWDFLLLRKSPPYVPSHPAHPGLFRRLPASFAPLMWTFLGGAPFLIYAFLVIRIDPFLAVWNAQNITPSPPLWDLLLSLSPALLLAVPGAWLSLRLVDNRARLLVAWLVVDLLLLYLPVSLQRRLMTGLFIPVVGLAAIGIQHWLQISPRRARLALIATLILALPTNLVLLLAAFSGIQSHNSLLYLHRNEAHALVWIAENTPARAIILAAPETSLFIPAHTGRRVLYGHPFETLNAEQEKIAVAQFYAADLSDALDYLAERQVDYIFFGPREQDLGTLPPLPGWQPVYQVDGVVIYARAIDG